MSFQYVPSRFRIPPVPNFTPPAGMWRGKRNDDDYLAFHCAAWGGYIMVDERNPCYCLQVDDYVMRPVFSNVNGYIYWQGGAAYVYMTQSNGWVWCQRFPGYEPLEDWKKDGEYQEYRWTGDKFYKLDYVPYYPGNEVTMRPRGSIRDDGEEKTVTAVWPRWVARNGEFGVYDGQDGESGERVLGLPRYKGDGEYFVRSLNREKGYFTYGRIHCSKGRWVIGEIDSPGGWHEGSEPKPNGSVTFRFMKPEGSEAEGTDITVSFHDYVCGEETEAAYLGSVAIWR